MSEQEKKHELIDTFSFLGTEVINEDVFQDRFEIDPKEIDEIKDSDIPDLWLCNPNIYSILKESKDVEEARKKLYDYLNECENSVFSEDHEYHILEKANMRECVRAFKSIIAPINEKRTKVSSLKILYNLAQGTSDKKVEGLFRGFILEFMHLFRGIVGLSGIYSTFGTAEKKSVPEFIVKDGREAANLRSDFLDKLAGKAEEKIQSYKTGLEEEIIKKRKENKERILKILGGSEEDWNDYKWHVKKVITTAEILSQIIDLSEEEKESIKIVEENKIPFGITPYYASLLDKDKSRKYDHAVRSQVIPPLGYSKAFVESKHNRNQAFDFMGEHDTSPIDLITRRYPEIVILKPYNTCAQICVYCQRNWEIDGVLDPKALCSKEKVNEAIQWIKEHESIRDVLITGGDPFILKDNYLEEIIDKISKIEHVLRIRIGTRTIVVDPFRITESLCKILDKYNEPGKREICIVTHFEHVYEITPESMEAVQKLKKARIPVYNQEVFTSENSRRFESAALRRNLRLIGVDPYYTFVTKGKEETSYYRVPIARILQERKEEARLFPGLDRTDEPVFNVPRLGKNHLRSWQDHRLVMILPDGRRVYEFHPWEKFITPVPPYNYIDVSIASYLRRLKEMGEDLNDYKTIWYYF